MIAVLNLAILAIATIFAAGAAAGLNWLCLHAAVVLMQPATARRVAPRQELARGTAQLARAYASIR